jgi:hypothetical protein
MIIDESQPPNGSLMKFFNLDDSIEKLKQSDGFAATTISAAKVLGLAAVNVAIFTGNEILSGRAGEKIAEQVEKEKHKLEK